MNTDNMQSNASGRAWAGRLPWLAACVCAAMAIVHFSGIDAALRMLREDGVAVSTWKAWASALAHEGPAHFWLNFVAALVAFSWLELLSRRSLAWVLVLGAPAGSFAAMLAFPPLGSYCGMSCVLHAAAAALAVEGWRREGRAVGVLAFAALGLKVVSELCGMGSLAADPAQPWVVTTPAGHAAGLLVGVLVGLACRRRAPLQGQDSLSGHITHSH